MKRNISLKLEAWLKNPARKPLILRGTRQVGKTYSVEEFAKSHFKNFHVYNFEENKTLHKIFEKDFDTKRILEELSYVNQVPIDINNDLVFFDEIQECPKALTSLKYFCENMRELAIVSAGSLLGVRLSSESFPVGKVDFLHLFPMNFREFLMANENQMLVQAYDNASCEGAIADMAHSQLWKELLNYYVTGGMPEAVKTYIANKENKPVAFGEVRRIQKALLDSFNKDFAKHSGKNNAVNIVSVLENVPLQMSKTTDDSTKRYFFNHVIPGKKSFAQLQGPIDWLEKAGLVLKIYICNRAETPLKAFCKNNIFKLFVFDVGLLGTMLSLPVGAILDQDYGISKGYLAENFVAQEFVAAGDEELYSWTERNSEIEFLKNLDNEIVPIEVKSGYQTQAKSLKQFLIKYSPKKAIKLSANQYSRSGSVVNLPLYLAGKL